MFSPDLWHRGHRISSLPLADVYDILCSQRADSLWTVVFDTVYPTATGFVARSTRGNDPRRYGVTLSARRDWSCDVVIPLS